MRTCVHIILVGAVFSLTSGSAYAGVYSTVEPRWTLNPDYFRSFQEKTLTPLKQLASPEAKELWQKSYELAAMAALDGKDAPPLAQPDSVPVQQRVNEAICLLRVRMPGKDMPKKALELLRTANRRDQLNFLIMSAYGTAFQITGDYDNASQLFSDARPFWKKPLDQLEPAQQKLVMDTLGYQQKLVMGKLEWTEEDSKQAKEEYAWFAKCEEYQHKLVKFRLAERLKGVLTFATAVKQIDPLFETAPLPKGQNPLLFFSGENGTFEPGKITAANKAKLPPDAIKIVQQLLVWTPDDLRLFWLLGELLNAQGDVESAKIVFSEVFGKYQQTAEVQKLGKIEDANDLVEKFVQDFPAVGKRFVALRDYRTPPEGIAPAAGQKTDDTKPSDNPKPDTPEFAPLKLDWQTLGVGFGGGSLAGFLLAWRVRDLLRRRQGRSS
jgi:tetratricopeptide (TPR) repeat protein